MRASLLLTLRHHNYAFQSKQKISFLFHCYGSDATLLIMRVIYEIPDAVALVFIGREVGIDGEGCPRGSSNRPGTQAGIYPGHTW